MKKRILLAIISLLVWNNSAVFSRKPNDLSFIQSIFPRNYEKRWLRAIVINVIDDLQLQSMVIWSSSIMDSNKGLANILNREFSKHSPILQLESRENKTFRLLPAIRHSGGSLNVILLNEESVEHFESSFEGHLKTMANFAGIWPRTWTLVIILGDKRYSLLRESIKKMLILGWKRYKFADLSVIYIFKKSKESPHVLQYQMFERRFVDNKLNNATILFPNKLKDMKGYKFTISKIRKNLSEEEAKVYHPVSRLSLRPSDNMYVKYIFCEARNCTFATANRKDTPIMLNGLQSYHHKKYPEYLLKIACYEFVTLRAIIPHHEKSQTSSFTRYLNHNLLIFVLIMTNLLLVLRLIRIILNLDDKKYEVLKIFNFILGISVIRFEKGLIRKMFYLSLVVLSFIVSNGLVELATEFEFETTRVSVKDLQELLRMGLPIFSNYGLQPTLSEKEFNNTFKNRITIFDCYGNLSIKNNIICITNPEVIAFRNGMNKKINMKGYRQADFDFAQNCHAVTFENGSAFAIEFHKLIWRSLDHGLLRRPTIKESCQVRKYEFVNVDYNVIPNDESDFYWSLFFGLIICHFFSVVILLSEVLSVQVLPLLNELFEKFMVWMRNRYYDLLHPS